MTPQQARMSYRRMMDATGETIHLVHQDFNTGSTTTVVRARVSGYEPQELVAGIDQGSRRVIILSEDVPAEAYPVKNDRVILRPGTPQSRTLAIIAVDDSTRRIAGELIAFDITAQGA